MSSRLFLAALAVFSVSADPGGYAVVVTAVEGPVLGQTGDQVLMAACQGWRLSTADAARLLALSVPITAEERQSRFFWLPCSIAGSGMLDGERVQFEINAAGTVVLRRADGGATLLGCEAPDCAPLVLMMPDES